MWSFAHDLRLSIRALIKAPAYAIWILVIVGTGIGVNAAVFTVLDRVLIRTLPYAQPERLVQVWEDFSAFGTLKSRVSPGTFFDWQRRATSLSDLAAYRLSAVTVSGGAAPEEVSGIASTANLLPTLGVRPALGRTFSPDEERTGARVVVLSEGLWRRRFNADPVVVGGPIVLNGDSYVVVGVMPASFLFPDAETAYWIPLSLPVDLASRRNSHFLYAVGRIAGHSTLEQVRSEMTGIASQLATEFPATNRRVGITVVPLKEELVGGTDRVLVILMTGAACVLLIACMNVANLVLVRWSHRRSELGIRAALGASRARILRPVLGEGLVLGIGSVGVALVAARWGAAALSWLIPPGIGNASEVLPGRGVMMLTVAAGITVTLIASVLPVLGTWSGAVVPIFSSSARIVGARGGPRLRQILLASEVALALVLVVCAGLMIATLTKLSRVELGFDPDHVLTARLADSAPKYRDPLLRSRFFTRVIDDISGVPGVRSVGLTSDLPYTSRGNTMSIAIENRPTVPGPGQDTLFRLVSTRYLDTIGARLLAGRLLNERDTAESTPVVVVNDAFIGQYLRSEDPLGVRINSGTGTDEPKWLTIVGVVAEIRERGAELGAKPAVYVPFTQTTITFFQPSELAIRTSVAPMSIVNAVQRAVWTIDPDQPITDVRTFQEVVNRDQAIRRSVLSLLALFACLALLVAAFGIYSVLSYLVTEQRAEIAVRMALGAGPRTIVRSVVQQSAAATLTGIGLGLIAAALLTRLLGSLLFELSPLDPSVLALATAVLVAVAAFAAYVPARRAAGIDPMSALRI